jgi:class 3 adenylate cyclase/tetratricopeptide (TPR) repeat protein
VTDAHIETATILFSDLVGSTAIRSAVGDEVADRLRREHDTLVKDGIGALEGRVVKSLGDGFMATFTSASDALQAAVAVQQALERRNRTVSAGPELHVRIGVAAGDVVHEDGDAHGLPVVQAARLCDLAGADEILSTSIVGLLAGSRFDVETHTIGAPALKGIEVPIDCLRVDWRSKTVEGPDVPLQSFLSNSSDSALCGRIDEMELLRAAWRRTSSGASAVRLVSGEPGVGKTRLVTELANEVVAGGGLVLAGRIEEGLGGPYQPFVEALLHYVRHARTDDGEVDLGDSPGELTRIIPDLGDLVSGLPAPIRADPGTEQFRLAASVTSWVATVARDAPVLVVIDDFHWAAPQTAVVLRHLCVDLPSRVLVVITFRDTDVAANPDVAGVIADLHRLPDLENVPLRGLDTRALRGLVEAAGVAADRVETVTQAIHQHSEGNPFFAIELLRHLGDGQLTGDAGTERLIGQLPTSVTEVVRRRVGRLGPATTELLTVAAVVGRDFSLATLAAVMDDHDGLIDQLESAISANLAEERGVGQYRFVHRLVAETLLGQVSATRRAHLHLRVAAAIERQNAANVESVVSELAYHYLAAAPAGDLHRTVEIVVRAGRRAMQMLAFAEAVDLFEQALRVDPEMELGERADITIELARAQSLAGDDASTTVSEAAALARELGDDRRLAAAALAREMAVLGLFGQVDTGRTQLLAEAIDRSADLPLATQARLHAELGLELVFENTDRKLSEANVALDLARRSGSPETLGRVLALRYATLWTAHTLEERMQVIDDLDVIAAELNDRYLDFLASANGTMAMLEFGDIERAAARLERAERIADRLGEPRLRWFASVCRAKLEIITGQLDAADRSADCGAALARRAGRADYMSYRAAQAFCIGFHRGRVDDLADAVDAAVERNPAVPAFRALRITMNAELGRLDAAREELAELAGGGFLFPADFTQVVALCFSGHGAARTGEVAIARRVYDRLVVHEGRFADAGSTWYGAVDYFLGELATAFGDFDRAADHLDRAERLHGQVGSGPMSDRTRVAADELRRRRQSFDASPASTDPGDITS